MYRRLSNLRRLSYSSVKAPSSGLVMKPHALLKPPVVIKRLGYETPPPWTTYGAFAPRFLLLYDITVATWTALQLNSVRRRTLLFTQGLYWVHARGPPRWTQHGGQRHSGH